MRSLLLLFTCFLLFTTACSKEDGHRPLLGVSFATLAEERWSREKDRIAEEAAAMGMDTVFQTADGDESVQNDQIENLVTLGVDVLIVIPQNSAAAVSAVESAHREGIPCIAYDRFIPATTLDLYVSFDSVKVGEKQAAAVVEKAPTGRYFWLGGSPTDDNAHRVREGHMHVLAPLLESGRIELVGEQWCAGWSPEEALKHTENALTAHQNRIDAVLASNDGIAGAAIQALRAQGLAGKIPVSGQDADLAACQRIAAGTQTVTVFKDIRRLVHAAVAAARDLATGSEPAAVNSEFQGRKAILLDVEPVTRENLYQAVVLTGYHSRDEVYRHIPRDQWPGDG